MVAGHSLPGDPQNVRRRISVTGQYAAVDTLLTGFENLTLLGELNHLGRKNSRRRAEELLDQFVLTDFGDIRAGNYSGGMLRRLDIAMSLVARPVVVFIDEPTTCKSLKVEPLAINWFVEPVGVGVVFTNGALISIVNEHVAEPY